MTEGEEEEGKSPNSIPLGQQPIISLHCAISQARLKVFFLNQEGKLTMRNSITNRTLHKSNLFIQQNEQMIFCCRWMEQEEEIEEIFKKIFIIFFSLARYKQSNNDSALMSHDACKITEKLIGSLPNRNHEISEIWSASYLRHIVKSPTVS